MLSIFKARPTGGAVVVSGEGGPQTPECSSSHMDSDWNDAFDSFMNFSLHGTGAAERGGGKRVMKNVGLGRSSPGFFSSLLGGSQQGSKASTSDYELVRTQLDGLSGLATDDDDDLLF